MSRLRTSLIVAIACSVLSAGGTAVAQEMPGPNAVVDEPTPVTTYTPYSETVTNADGTRTATVYGTPTFRQVDGAWRRIDPRLREAVDTTYPFEVENGATPLRLGRSRAALAQFALPEGAVTVTLRGDTTDRAPRRAGQQLRCDDVAARVDLDVSFPGTGVRIDHVIAGPSSPHRFRYRAARSARPP